MINILLVTQDDPFYIPVFFKEVFRKAFPEKFIIKGVIIQPALGRRSIKKIAGQMLDFYGYRNFLAVGFKFIIYKLLNYLAVNIFKGNFPGEFSCKHIVLKNNLNIIEIGSINSLNSVNFLRSLNIDVIFSIAASQVFKKEILDLPKIGCFNIHTSKLPKNRGMMPNFWSLFNYDNDPVSAVTIHKMNEKLDDGEIILQQEFKLNPEESLDALIKRTKKLSAELFIKALEILDKDVPIYKNNDSGLSSYNTFPGKEDVKKFKSKGLKLR